MSASALAPWLVMAALVAGLLFVLGTGRQRLEWLLKPAAAATFVVTALRVGALETAFGRVMFAGLVLAAAGDVLLLPKSKRFFLFGLVAFLLGHVGYAVAFVVRGIDPVATACAALLLGMLAIPILRWLWPHVEAPMRIPVMAYVAVITAMVALAAGTVRREGEWLLLLGAVGFYLSDLAVARDRFVERSFTNRLWGLPLYFFAQLLLATLVAAAPAAPTP